MIVIDDKIVSDEVVKKDFVCNLTACKGACCVEGESGAPLEPEEVEILEQEFSHVKPYLTPGGIKAIEVQGKSVEDKGIRKTPLINGGPCAYIQYDTKGVAMCGIELAWQKGDTSIRKPISCHLYPIRIKEYKTFTAVNYEKWEICDPACVLGQELQVPVYKFLKESLIRKFGSAFYKELDARTSKQDKV